MAHYLKNLSAVKKRYLGYVLAFSILLFMFLVAFFSSHGAFGIPGDSGTTDEVAHIPSGYSYVEYGDYRLNPEHPPLVKALAGIPLALDKNIKGIKDNWSWDGINQWESGWYILYQNGNNPATVLTLARLPMMLLMILLGFFLYKWGSELFGKKAGLTILLLYALYPDIIAHGRLVTTDIGAALGFVITMYYFNKAITKKTWKYIAYAGIAFGIAQLLKFSAILLYGILFLLIFIRAYFDRMEGGFWREFWKDFKIYFWICLFSLILVWLVYIPFVWNTPVGIEHKLIEINLTSDPRTLPLRNFLHLFEGNVVMRALGHYLLGVMLVFARVAGGNATFALGHLSDQSISWYFPFAWLIKTPISIIILFLSSVVYIVWNKFFHKDKKTAWTLWLIFMPWLIYWALTLKGQLDIGIRHLMPTIPFVLLIIGFTLSKLYRSKQVIVKYIIGILVVFLAYSTLSNYPYFISYFNEVVPKDQRHNYLTDSSLDWGQDLLRLKKYVDDNHIESIKVDYFGGSVPSYYIPQSKDWHSSYGPTTGWLAVSATFYQSSKLYGEKEGKWSYGWLDNIKPTAIIGGGSILVYDITDQTLRDNPPISPYPIKLIEYPKN